MIRRLRNPVSWLLCLVILGQPLVLRASPQARPPPPAAGEKGAVDLLGAGKGAYRDLDYERGVELLRGSLEGEALPLESRREAQLLLGLCLASLGLDLEARQAFQDLLELDPGFRLDEKLHSPKILAVFDLAKKERAEHLRIRDRDPPGLEVPEIVQPLPYKKEIRVTARATDEQGVAGVQIFFRRRGENTYTFLPMTEQGPGVYAAVIPSYMADQECLEYYVLVMDRAGNATLKGNAALPLVLRIEPGAEFKPWYKKWWVWAIIGAAAGTGAALGIALSGGDGESKGGTATLQIGLE